MHYSDGGENSAQNCVLLCPNCHKAIHYATNECKEELLQNVWEYNTEVSTHTIETHIYRLRKKVEKDNDKMPLILAEDGGYKLAW